jgi:chromosome segregation ATPase
MFGEKSLIQQLHARHRQNSMPFGGRVVPIETRDPSVEIIERTPPTLQQRLLDLPIADAELKKRRQKLVAALGALTMEAEELIEEVNEQRTAGLEEELETIRAAGRNQQKIVATLKADHDQTVLAMRNAREQVEDLTERLKDLQSQRIDRWSGKPERTAHQKKIDAAQGQLRVVSSKLVSAGQAQQAAWQELNEAQAAMKTISDAEFRCRGALSGRSYRDPEFGLEVAPTI